jgi:hypothetical protein
MNPIAQCNAIRILRYAKAPQGACITIAFGELDVHLGQKDVGEYNGMLRAEGVRYAA